MSNELSRREDALPEQTMEIVSAVVREMMAPIMESFGRMLRQNAEALEQMAATQKLTSDRITSLERQVRLQKPLSRAQERCVNDAIRARARALLDKYGISGDRRAATKLGNAIRRSVLARYGVSSLREAPAYDYEVAMEHVGMWNELLTVLDVVKEARARAELEQGVEAVERDAGVDAGKQVSKVDDQGGEPRATVLPEERRI